MHEQPYHEETCASIPSVEHEFPNGFHDDFGVERFKIAEALFDPSGIRGTKTGAMMGAAHVVTTSVGMCDVDLRCSATARPWFISVARAQAVPVW